MREMKDSGIEWIGEIPKDWSYSKVKYHCSMKSGDNITSLNIEETSHYPVYGGNGQRGYFSQYNVDGDKILIGRQGALAGNVHYVSGKFWATDHAIVTTPFKDINILYFFYLLKGYELNRYAQDTAAQPGLAVSKIMNLAIYLPSVCEQQQIADFLDSKCSEIDATAEDIQKEISLLEEYKKSVITEAVTKGLNPDAEMKDSGIEWIGEIPKHWKVTRLKYILSEAMKYGANETGVEYSSEMPRYIRITDISLDGKLKDTGKLSLPNNVAKEYILKDKAILFARSGATVGKTFIYKSEYGKMAFAGYLISAYCNEKLFSPELLYYFTNSFAYSEWINRVFSQSTIQNIGADKYVNMILTVPKIVEQQQIVSYLDFKCSEIDTLIADKKHQLDILADYKKSLIYEYVTGKKEVPVKDF